MVALSTHIQGIQYSTPSTMIDNSKKTILIALPFLSALFGLLFIVIYLLDRQDVSEGVPEQFAMLGVPIFLGLFLLWASIIAIAGFTIGGGLLLCHRIQRRPVHPGKFAIWFLAIPLEIYSAIYCVVFLVVFIPKLFN